MIEALILLACLGAGTLGGIFFAFSSFVMKALGDLPTAQGVAAMQRINVVVLNPVFLALFVGTAVLGVACVALAFFPWSATRSTLLIAAGALYVVGSFLVTGRFNVPLNNRLGRLDAESPEAAAYWPQYIRQWLEWNHVRSFASVASCACSALALAQ
ncbi:MAG TPA: anthrone oxygenase family protein [Rhodanobacteraceae bacterium]|nr:anthrone oxygenase family protein [Rhodanobacteraceae bacterium]